MARCLGFVGRNGAGKSTLLKLLSRITYPTRGRIEIHGRVGSLLEVGTGFHPELTGRENIFLNGAVLGMSRAEIARKFDEIVAFSEVEQFLDTPVKRYSSGMYVRLAFAVAAHLEPEILVVDEVLAVGDAAFQQKCMGKMGAASRQGKTVLIVSHSLARGDQSVPPSDPSGGGTSHRGGAAPADVVRRSYLANVRSACGEVVWPSADTAPGTDDGSALHAVRILQQGRRGRPHRRRRHLQGCRRSRSPTGNFKPWPAALFRVVAEGHERDIYLVDVKCEVNQFDRRSLVRATASRWRFCTSRPVFCRVIF